MAASTDGWHESLPLDDRAKSLSNRGFGVTLALLFAALGGWSLWTGGNYSLWLFGLAAGFFLVALALPGLLAPLNRAFVRLSALLKSVAAPIVLAVIFFGVITPVGMLMRLLGRDPLRRRIDANRQSYWIDRQVSRTRPPSMKDQF